jgi:hypothetical protein
LKFSITCLALLLAAIFAIARVKPSAAGKPDDFFTNLAIQHVRNIEHRKRADLVHFFDRYRAAKPYPITAYINASEKYGVDYRLLPAISIAESSGGLHACGNNWFGWQSCKGSDLGSVADYIQYVSQQLANGVYYRGKTIDQKLRAYNPNPAYTLRVEQFMREISQNP